MKNCIAAIILLALPTTVLAEKPEGIWAWHEADMAEQLTVLEQGMDNPCGPTHKVVINKMPEVGKARAMGLETTLEYKGKKVINRWVVPIDTTVLAIEDEDLIVSQPSDSLLINIHGFFTLIDKHDDTAEELERCPSFLKKEFKDPDNLKCLKIPDKKTSRKRYIAYKGPCL